MKILTIIVAYNGLQWYDRCLGSLQHSTIPVDIMVIDNASQDGSADWIAEHYPEINLYVRIRTLDLGRRITSVCVMRWTMAMIMYSC